MTLWRKGMIKRKIQMRQIIPSNLASCHCFFFFFLIEKRIWCWEFYTPNKHSWWIKQGCKHIWRNRITHQRRSLIPAPSRKSKYRRRHARCKHRNRRREKQHNARHTETEGDWLTGWLISSALVVSTGICPKESLAIDFSHSSSSVAHFIPHPIAHGFDIHKEVSFWACWITDPSLP